MTDTADAVVVHPLAGQRSAEQRHRVRAARFAFRRWRRTRPFWAGVWTMVGGAIIAYVPATAFKLLLVANASLIIGILVGSLVGFFGLLLWFFRSLHVVLGVLILLLSLTSFLTSDFGGLLIGMLMGLVGGSLAIAWVPSKETWRQRRRARKLATLDEPTEQTESSEQTEPAATIADPSADEPETHDLATELLGSGGSAYSRSE